MKIEPPADDLGLQHLKTTDRAKGKVGEVDHVEPYARIAPSEERRDAPLGGGTAQGHTGPQEQPAPQPHPRQGERRSGVERRQRQQPTLLDTRSPHERRTELRRADDRAAATQQPPDKPAAGIDELA